MKNRSSSTVPVLLVVNSRLSQDQALLNTNLARWYSEYFGQPWQDQNPNLITLNDDQEGIKIDDIRKLQSLLSYSVGPDQHRIVVLYGFESTQPVAQNAMLKMLEEPPENTQFILITKNLSPTLPTIKSRCIMEHLETTEPTTAQELPYQPADLLQKISNSKTGELLALSEEFSDRQDATKILEALLIHLHAELRANPTKQYTHQITTIQACLNDLKANVNVKLTLDHCWMELVR